AATAEANRLYDAAVSEPMFVKMAPSLVLFVDAQGITVGRNGSAQLRGDKTGEAHPSLTASIKSGRTASALWFNQKRQEQMLISYAPIRGDNGAVIGALVVGTPLNDERLTRTSELTSGQALLLAIAQDDKFSSVADSAASNDVVSASGQPSVSAAVKQALSS